MKFNVIQAAVIGGVIGWVVLFLAAVFSVLAWRVFSWVLSWVF